MRVCIHRGAHEIGGSCVEVAAGDDRIVLDLGMPLMAPGGGRRERFDFRPFRDLPWVSQNGQSGTGASRVIAGALRGLSLTYNKSDSFRPQDPKIDIFLRHLPNPSGRGEDYGFWLNMFDGRV
ncbi:MAG: hypothetical protein WCK05_06570, partial [Planctomycetota bacterium]